jgi:hypothetical protein
LIQFPIGAPVYFSYTAPLAALSASALLSRLRRPAITFYILFALLDLHRANVHESRRAGFDGKIDVVEYNDQRNRDTAQTIKLRNPAGKIRWRLQGMLFSFDRENRES